MRSAEADASNPDESVDYSRREALAAIAGGGLMLGGAKAVDNIAVGYGVVSGTNLIEQDLPTLVGARFQPSSYVTRVDGHAIGYDSGDLLVQPSGGFTRRIPISAGAPVDVADVDAKLGLDGSLSGLAADLRAVSNGLFEFAFSQYPAFIDHVTGADARPLAVAALRGHRVRDVAPSMVHEFTAEDPADPGPLIEGLARGFREYSAYDLTRYAAGSIQDNVIFGAADLRDSFRSATDFEALLSDQSTGLFCYEFAYRSLEAFHAVAPQAQAVPVLGAVVTDARHKHVYTGLASVVRERGKLIVPMTFLDYTHSTLYDDLDLRGVLGNGVAAYDRRHRTDDVYWNRYARW